MWCMGVCNYFRNQKKRALTTYKKEKIKVKKDNERINLSPKKISKDFSHPLFCLSPLKKNGHTLKQRINNLSKEIFLECQFEQEAVIKFPQIGL